MARESIDVLEFQRRFATEDACRQYLFRQRWPDGFICPRCGCREYSEIRSRHLYQCKSCRYQASLTAGTVFHKTHMPLQKWFWAVFLVAHDKGGCSAVRLSQQLNTRLETAWLMLHKIRAAMGQRESQYQLGGLVKLDDAFFGNREREGSSGRGTAKASVVVGVSETEAGNPAYVKMKMVKSLTSTTILDVAKEILKPKARVFSDGLLVYEALHKEGYKHDFAVISQDPESLQRFVWVHKFISNAKTFILGTYHGLGRKHLQAYLDEFCYRTNRRRQPKQLFSHLLEACVRARTVTKQDLVAAELSG